LSIPYYPPNRFGTFQSLETIVQHAPRLGYQLYFADPKSDTEILNQLKKFLTLVFVPHAINSSSGVLEASLLDQRDKKFPTVLTDKEFDYYHLQFSQGMHGPLNYYRTTEFRYNEESTANLNSNLSDDLSVLYLWGTLDIVVATSDIDKAKNFIKLFQVVTLEGRGHWLMIEAKNEVTDRIADWIDGLNLRSQRLASL